MEKDAGLPKSGSKARLTPAMEQYRAAKMQYPDCILFFQIGDFYETFDRDAETVSRELDIVLTSRSRGRDGNSIPLAGVPRHAADGYIARLVSKGYRVAISDQVEDPRNAKGVVRREVVRVITPGTVIDEQYLGTTDAHYLMAVYPGENPPAWGLAFLDISTGEFFVTACDRGNGDGGFLTDISRYNPSECLVPEDVPDHIADMLESKAVLVTRHPAGYFDAGEASRYLCEHFGVSTLEGYGITSIPAAIPAAGAVLRYARDTQKSSLPHIMGISVKNSGEFCTLDATTLRNLEVLAGIRGRKSDATVFNTLDRTSTAMGSRLLRKHLCAPLTSVDAINRRLDGVDLFFVNGSLRADIVAFLKNCADIERIAGRIAFGNANPRDLSVLSQSLDMVPQLISALRDQEGALPVLISDACGRCVDLEWMALLIGRSIVDEPPATVRNGGVIRDGYNAELDKLRTVSKSGREWISELQKKERERTGIKSLKLGYNSVFGYYIEVTRPNLHLVPEDYHRKQTTANGERFTIPELKEMESLITSADEKLLSMEQVVYEEILQDLRQGVPDLQASSAALAEIDVAASQAETAAAYDYVRPVIDDSGTILIREGRHPVVERQMQGAYVPNDAHLSADEDQILIITGANMAGKSTYMRGVALITIMAQSGCFVPASYAGIGVVDRVFTRVGAFDDLASGQSTFMVEMLEVANILNNVTDKSLVILDEIGRGTSTLDGYCIARAVLDFLHGKGASGPRTLFATHFHELVSAEAELKRVKNFHFAVKDTGKDVVFLRRLIPGATDRSYGIHVASLAGVPKKVVLRAEKVMDELMKNDTGKTGTVKRYTQMLLVDHQEGRSDTIADEIRAIDPESITPLEAINLLYTLRKKLKDGE